MPDKNEKIFKSSPSEPNDEFWLDQGKKMIESSLTNIHEAAKALLTGLGLLQSVYLGICGFADYIPKNSSLCIKSLYILPLLIWLISIYKALEVMKTKRYDIILLSPDKIRSCHDLSLKEKQKNLNIAFYSLALGLVSTLVLMIIRFQF